MITPEIQSARTSQERHELILKRVEEQGHVTVRDLAQLLGVSEATVRRDLKQLALLRLLELVYGGATAPRRLDQSLQARGQRNIEAKRIIGELAGALVRDHEMLYVDAGTTCYEMRHALNQRRNLTLIVNSARLATDLQLSSDSSLILLAGSYRPERMDTVGPLSLQSIEQLRGYSAFIGADGLCQSFGVSASEMLTASLYQHIIKNAKETILLADHSKFGSPSLFRISGFEEVSTVVTDRDPGTEWRSFFSDQGIDLVLPDSPPQG